MSGSCAESALHVAHTESRLTVAHSHLKTDSTSSVRLMCMAAAAASAADEAPPLLLPRRRSRLDAAGSEEEAAAAAAAAADDEMKTEACRPMSVLHSCSQGEKWVMEKRPTICVSNMS